MALRRKTLKSKRSRMRKIDKTFAYIGYTIITLYAVFLLCAWISLRPALHITSVTVEGAHAISEEGIRNVAVAHLDDTILFWVKRNNQILFPVMEMERAVKSLSPRIANVKTAFDSHHHMRVIITEYTPNFLYCMRSDLLPTTSSSSPSEYQPKDCYFADVDGYVYAEAPEYIGYPFVAIVASSTEEAVTHQSPIGTTVLTEDAYSRIRMYIDDLSRVGLTTHSVTLLGGGDIRAEVGMPWVLLLATSKEPDRTIANLGVVLENLEKTPDKGKGVREIDLRFGNKIFYK